MSKPQGSYPICTLCNQIAIHNLCCENCYSRCCSDCHKNFEQCVDCKSYICENCDILVQCAYCPNFVCDKCQHQCYGCHKNVCHECTLKFLKRSCEMCNSLACDDCVYSGNKCVNCNNLHKCMYCCNFACNEKISWCSGCNFSMCDTCNYNLGNNCKGCNKLFCNYCRDSLYGFNPICNYCGTCNCRSEKCTCHSYCDCDIPLYP